MVWPFSSWSQPRRQSDSTAPGDDDAHRHASTEDCDDFNVVVETPKTNRVSLGLGSTTVYGYPSSGGMLMLPYCNGVDLEFLGLSRFEGAKRSEDPVAEDGHCHQMRKLGAWKFRRSSDYDYMSIFEPKAIERMKLVVAAWPEDGSGVWVIASHVDVAAWRGLGCVWNCLSMEERCEQVQRLGGTFYEDPTKCPDLDLQEGPNNTEGHSSEAASLVVQE